MKNFIKDKSGKVTLLELLMIVFIIVFSLILGYIFYTYRATEVQNGTDALNINTAESVAIVNSSNGASCSVDGCSGGQCIHYLNGSYYGYYDVVSNKVLGEKTEGYNETKNPELNGIIYHGERHSLVLRVRTGDGNVKLEWVKE